MEHKKGEALVQFRRRSRRVANRPTAHASDPLQEFAPEKRHRDVDGTLDRDALDGFPSEAPHDQTLHVDRTLHVASSNPRKDRQTRHASRGIDEITYEQLWLILVMAAFVVFLVTGVFLLVR